MRRSLLTVVAQVARSAVDEHEAILELIEEGAPAVEIEAATREHGLQLIDGYRRTYADQAAAV